MEIWDGYDKELKKAGVDLIRGNLIPDELYHIVAEVVLRHTDGSFLAMQRDWNKRGGGLFEITAGGSILKGEEIEAGAVRELQEETGIKVESLSPLYNLTSDVNQTHYFGYLAYTGAAKDSVTLQEKETIDYKWIAEADMANYILSDEVVFSTRDRVWPNLEPLL
ncbi:NUDIX domain-containing protein [Macrococcus carouselicus]|uniref:NUDIX hydrolase n=1 Tax=Macrococcus carouselicus TaxID=69969 RepID=A0A9Q8CCH5_9STAP|nr:NUDIX hydrolase [Macrococcus carouselicus]TDL96632.1 NUDIX hydrolase [Macrococcus carouselicus]